jgi:hypothetical protein
MEVSENMEESNITDARAMKKIRIWGTEDACCP